MSAVRRFACCCLAILLLTGVAYTISNPAAAQDWLRDSMRWEARARVLKSVLVMEAEVLRTGLTTVEIESGCEWISELWLRPLATIWGSCADDSIRVYSGAVPATYHRIGALMAFADSVGDPDCMLYQLDEQAEPLPVPGTVGLFQLQSVGAVTGELNLGPVTQAFQARGADDTITVPGGPGRDDHVWQYDAFRSALVDAAASRRLDALLAGDSLVVLVRLAPWKSRERKRNAVTGSLNVRLPLEIERLYRGTAPDSCGLSIELKSSVRVRRVDPEAARRSERESRRLALILQELPASRALVVGHVDSTDVFPIECLAVDGDGRLRVIDPAYGRGELQPYRYHDLTEVEMLMQ